MAESSPSELAAFAAALSIHVAGKQEWLADHLGVSQAAVSGWVTGKSEPTRAKVFATEKALKLKPGSLSSILGYLPKDAKPIRTVEEAIEFDAGLSSAAKELLRGAYRNSLRVSSRSAR